jgi:outer membrane receptor protein involved in Fe transport
VAGYQLPGVPKWSYSLTADYDWVLTPGFSARIGGGYRWVGEQWLTGVQKGAASAPAVRAPSYSLLGFNASISHAAWTLKAYVTNVTDKRAIQGGLALIDLGNNGVQGDMYVVQPRTIGLGLDVSF